MSFRLKICEQAKSSFDYLKELSPNHLKTLCSLVYSYITNEKTTMTFSKLQNCMGIDENKLEQCIYAVGYMYFECMKNHVNPFDFAEVVSDAQLSEDIISILSQTYDHMTMTIKKEKANKNTPTQLTISQYTGLQWRLDVEISNKSLYRTYKPSYLLQVDSIVNEKKQSDYFECDYQSLKSIHQKLQNAIQSDWELCCHDFHYLIHK